MNRMNVDERRAKLVDAAIEVMLREGVERTTTRAIVSEAGMTTGAFHYSFFSKEELELEVMRALNLQAFDDSWRQTPGDASAEQLIEQVVTAFVESLVAEAPRRQLAFELTLHALREPGLRDAAIEHSRVKLERTARFLDGLASAGGFMWRLPTGELARLALSVSEGTAYQWLVSGDEASLGRIHETLVDFLLTQVAALEPAEVGSRSSGAPRA